MDVFEYTIIVLYFKSNEVSNTKARAFLDIITFDQEGNQKVETVDLESVVDREHHQRIIDTSEGFHRGEKFKFVETWPVHVSSNYALRTLAPYLAKFGAQGWEVVEYKTASEPAIGQVLLKKKIEKD